MMKSWSKVPLESSNMATLGTDIVMMTWVGLTWRDIGTSFEMKQNDR